MHSNLWELFTPLRESKDPEAYEIHLRDADLRNRFYERFSLYVRTLALALSSSNFMEAAEQETIERYKKDLKFFQNLRAAITLRYQEVVDFAEYEPRIKKLIDTHVGPGEVEPLCEPINLLNEGDRLRIIEENGKSPGAKADMIASATRHTIEKEMGKDPAFYKKFSRLLENVIAGYHQGRLNAPEALSQIKEISTKVVTRTDDDIPDGLLGNDMARRYFGQVRERISAYGTYNENAGAEIAIEIVDRIARHKIRDWRTNPDAINRMRGEIDDILFDIEEKRGLELSLDDHDAIIDRCIEVAIANED
jgi:type I restriction enzyme R subunit